MYFEELFRTNNSYLCIIFLHIDRQMSNCIETSGNFQGWHHLFQVPIKQWGKQADFDRWNFCRGRKGDCCHLSSLITLFVSKERCWKLEILMGIERGTCQNKSVEHSSGTFCNIYTFLEQNTGICLNSLSTDYEELKNLSY